ncbi:thiamine phosphate synthase [Parapedobacter composti]|nr:thiamine phosphate synthase [Parapedobacter composti]
MNFILDGRMQLLVITQEDFFPGEADVLNSMFEAGLSGLHLRKPQSSRYEMRALLRRIHADFHKRIVIHGHMALSAEFGLLGVHLPLGVLLEKGVPPVEGLVSCSTHTPAEVSAAARVADRAFISPVFDSISKKGYLGNAPLLTSHRPQGNTLWVALGGITPERLPAVSSHGFGAAAALGYIWKGGQPLQRFETYQAAAATLRPVSAMN